MVSPFALEVGIDLFDSLVNDAEHLSGLIQGCRSAEDPDVAADHAEKSVTRAKLVFAQLRQWDNLHAETSLMIAPADSELRGVIEQAKDVRRALKIQVNAVPGLANNEAKLYKLEPGEWVAMCKSIPDAGPLLDKVRLRDKGKIEVEKGRAVERLSQQRIDAANALLANPAPTPEDIEQLVRHAEEALLISKQYNLLPAAAEAIFLQIKQLP